MIFRGIINTTINEKNSLSVSGYYSNDKFDYYRESAFDYGNLASTLKWKHYLQFQIICTDFQL